MSRSLKIMIKCNDIKKMWNEARLTAESILVLGHFLFGYILQDVGGSALWYICSKYCLIAYPIDKQQWCNYKQPRSWRVFIRQTLKPLLGIILIKYFSNNATRYIVRRCWNTLYWRKRKIVEIILQLDNRCIP